MSRGTGLPEARTLHAMEHVRVLLLRGESGAGKTVALRHEVERLRAAGEDPEIVDMADGLVDVPSLLETLGDRRGLTIFLDGLDEAMTADRTLDVALRRAISDLQSASGARLRLTVRSGFPVDRLTDLLAGKFGDGFEHVTLAPLRSEDVMIAAMAEQIDPEAFLAAIEGLRVAPLAARPPTLKMLMGLWTKSGRLPVRRQDLYRQGCEVLVREISGSRLGASGGQDPGFTGHLRPAERVVVAARLAMLMTFGDHDRIDLAGEPSGRGLHLDAAIGGVGHGTDGDVRITARGIREVVGTSLFRPAGADGFAFAHPSLMRFLAAAFVTTHGLPPAQLIPLLSAPDGRTGANRIEVASWLGAIDHPYLVHLAKTDPQVLLRSGIPVETNGGRLDLAKSLLTLSATGGIDPNELAATGDLVLVAAQGLAAVLAPIIENTAEPAARRAFAVRMATDTGCIPVSACAAVAMDALEPVELRAAALGALANRVDEAHEVFLALSRSDEPEDGLRLAALGTAMRALLSPADVIRRLKPGNRLGAQSLLCLRLLHGIEAASLAEALAAITAICGSDDVGAPHDDHLMIAQGLAGRAFAHLDDVTILEALARFIATLPSIDPWLRWSFPLHKRGLPPAATRERRRMLISAVVAQAPDSVGAARNLLEASFVVRDDDLPWIVEEVRSALGGPSASVWSTLAYEVARGGGATPRVRLREAGADDSVIRTLTTEALRLPHDVERWTPPRGWDASIEAFEDQEEGEELGDSPADEAVEPIDRALVDWRLLTIQTDAGGRADAPSIEPEMLLALARRADRRVVLDSRDLLRVVLESLDRLRHRLKGRDPLVRALWDEGANSKPKDENFLSDFIVDHLRQDLVHGGIVADREVQLRSRLHGTPGQRTDIQVQAFDGGDVAGGSRRVASLTIEVKGCWNPDLHTAMKSQLLDRYLASTGETVGLYLVGWYVCTPWSVSRVAGLVPQAGTTLASVRATLETQARGLSNSGHHMEVAMIDATLA